jgi:F-type H+-transporting ATPase subunit b
MKFDWWTFAIQIVNFLVLVWLLHRFLYRPVAEIIEQRRKSVEHAGQAADLEKESAEAVRRDYEKRIEAIEKERARLLESANAQIEKDRQAATLRSKAESERMINEAQEKLTMDRDAALRDMRTQIGSMAAEMAARILKLSGVNYSDAAIADRLVDRIRHLPERERQRLAETVANSTEKIQVVTARAPSRQGRETWRRKLRESFGDNVRLEFVTDTELLGGAQLHFPSATLDCSWKGELEDVSQRLTDNE